MRGGLTRGAPVSFIMGVRLPEGVGPLKGSGGSFRREGVDP
jgi:hypothetical protein